jgi:hypothetical protein
MSEEVIKDNFGCWFGNSCFMAVLIMVKQNENEKLIKQQLEENGS